MSGRGVSTYDPNLVEVKTKVRTGQKPRPIVLCVIATVGGTIPM